MTMMTTTMDHGRNRVIGATLRSLLCLSCLLAGCKGLKPTSTGTAADAAAATDTKATDQPIWHKRGNPRLVAAIRRVIRRCKIDIYRGTVSNCKPPAVAAELQGSEREVGIDQALLTYCHAFGYKRDKLLRPLSRSRLAFTGTAKATRKASESAFRCLVDAIAPNLEIIEMNTLARVATYIGTSIGKIDVLLDKVSKMRTRTPEVVAYNAMWANGRLKVLDRFKSVLDSDDERKKGLRTAAIKGLGRYPPKPGEEQDKVCALLAPLMSRDDDIPTASAAAMRVSRSCADKRPEMLAAAEKLAGKDKFDHDFVTALAEWGLPDELKWKPAERRRAVRLLERVLRSEAIGAAVRGTALRGIHSLDPKRGRLLARRYTGPKASNFIRRAAELILGIKRPKVRPRKPPGKQPEPATTKQPPTKQPAKKASPADRGKPPATKKGG